LDEITRIEKELKSFDEKIDQHHVMVFYYKFASVYFGAANYKACIYYLDKIISDKTLRMREDLLCYSRILHLIAHFEAGEDSNIESLIKNTFKFLLKMDDLHRVQAEIIVFIRNLNNILPSELKTAFVELHANLKVLEDHPYEKRSFLYLDIISWLESRIESRSIQSVIKEKSSNLK
jgi:hypothetical protein